MSGLRVAFSWNAFEGMKSLLVVLYLCGYLWEHLTVLVHFRLVAIYFLLVLFGSFSI